MAEAAVEEEVVVAEAAVEGEKEAVEGEMEQQQQEELMPTPNYYEENQITSKEIDEMSTDSSPT